MYFLFSAIFFIFSNCTYSFPNQKPWIFWKVFPCSLYTWDGEAGSCFRTMLKAGAAPVLSWLLCPSSGRRHTQHRCPTTPYCLKGSAEELQSSNSSDSLCFHGGILRSVYLFALTGSQTMWSEWFLLTRLIMSI